ncbi:hypothetical protein BSKO_09111 [Bryopsis sp. KO-2023]|nr:hypothetical protein BSKO_09111 [Bryopsis sp. KO-2023]
MGSFGVFDVFVVVVSLVVVFAVGVHSSMKRRKSPGAENFFLAGRDMPWWIVGGSLFASNIGTEHFVGQAGSAAYSGIAVGLYDWSAAYLILALGWVFAPVYLRCNLTTVPELLEQRFNKHCRFAFVVITLFAYVVSKLGSSMYAGTVVLKTVAGLDIWESLPLILIGTAVYTITGGLSAVMLIDTVQMGIFLFGGILGSIIAFSRVDGIRGLFDTFKAAHLSEFPHLLRAPSDNDYPWPGMLFGIPVVSIWYWCVDQEMAQRVLSARNLGEAQLGTAFAALFKALPVFITVFPGMVARALFETCEVGDRWCDAKLDHRDHADHAYPLLVVNEFPTGVKGIMVASFLAAMMSSLSSVFNSASTIFTYDVYQRFYKTEGSSSSQHLLYVGRVTTAVLALLAFAWIPVIASQNRGLFELTQIAMTHLAPPVSALFIAALFFKKANGQGAISGLLVGTGIGIVRLGLYLGNQDACDRQVDEASNEEDLTWSNWVSCLNFNYFAMVLFALTLLLINIVSLFYPPPSPSQIAGRMVEFPWMTEISGKKSPRNPQVELANLQYDRLREGNLQSIEQDEDQVLSQEREHQDEEELTIESTLPSKGTGAFSEDRRKIVANCLGAVALITITSLIVIFH